MFWMRKVSGEEVRSTYKWSTKDPPLPIRMATLANVRL